jgi:hypothetical protein
MHQVAYVFRLLAEVFSGGLHTFYSVGSTVILVPSGQPNITLQNYLLGKLVSSLQKTETRSMYITLYQD